MLINPKNILHILTPSLIIFGASYVGVALYPFLSAPLRHEFVAITVRDLSSAIQGGVQKDIIISIGNDNDVLKSEELRKWVEPYTRAYTGKQELRLSTEMIVDYLESVASRLNTKPVDARLKFQNNRAEIFTPSTSGRELNIVRSTAILTSAIINNKSSVSLDFNIIEPEITLDSINSLGINTLLGLGESDYGKSPFSRIFNIKLGMAKFNGIMLKPGEEFSFNKFLGEVDEKSGYQPELVIKNGTLVSEYGGGLCQVATTFFRAAILSGLPILERRPHSFSVQYYNPQGFDATIYPGITDLRFLNDTPAHILIQARMLGSKLMVEIYGSSDGRKVEMVGPYQYDKQPTGAMKAYFTRKISRADQLVEEKRFDSVYKAPPAHPVERNPLE